MSAEPAIAATATGGPAGRAGIPGRRLLFALLVIFLVAVIPSVIVPTLMCRPGAPELDDLGVVQPFSLVDETGARFTEEALRGHPTIVGFVFTRCDTICPMISMQMHSVQEKTADPKGAGIKLLSLSVDPEYDTPARLAEYAARHRADPMRWRFLTGPRDAVHALVEKTFMISMMQEGFTASGAPQISHRGLLALVDGDLKIRKFYEANDVQALEQLMHDARYLARTHRSYKFGGGS